MMVRCPKCGGENVIKMGKIYKKGKIVQRYYCKDCMDFFTSEDIEPEKSHEKSRVQEQKPQSVKSPAPEKEQKLGFDVKGKQLVVIRTNRYYGKEMKPIIAVTGDAITIPKVKEYISKLFKWDERYEDYVRSYSETAYKKILSELYGMAKRYNFRVTKME